MSRIPDSRDSCAALPERLEERCRPLNEQSIEARGEFVLYWMHHAVRGHENPALDVATALGNRLGLAVLVYQGLGGNHNYDNDRHHTFILQGARDAHRDLEVETVVLIQPDPSSLVQSTVDAMDVCDRLALTKSLRMDIEIAEPGR